MKPDLCRPRQRIAAWGFRPGLWLGLCLCLFCCSVLPARALELVDSRGVTVRLERPAQRIIALYGAFNEILLALDARETLVARTAADAAIPGLQDLPAVGTHMRPNAELVAARQPDVVLQLAGRQEVLTQTEALEAVGLHVHHARGKTLPFAVLPGKRGQPVAHLIAHPARELLKARAHAGKAGGLLLRRSGSALFPGLTFFLLCRPVLPGRQPFGHPFRLPVPAEGRGLLRHEQQKRQGMLAGDFPAGAGTGAGRAGKIHLDLIGLGTAPLTEPPYRGFIGSQGLPFPGGGQRTRRLDRRLVRGHGKNSIHRDTHTRILRKLRWRAVRAGIPILRERGGCGGRSGEVGGDFTARAQRGFTGFPNIIMV